MGLGLIRPDVGEVNLFGARPSPHAFGRIGFLPEERGLYKKQTARESIAHVARLNGMHKREAFTRADEMLERYGLGDVARAKVKTLSKGMAQKVQLLAAIAHDPEFSILDEPFSGLDPVNQQVLEGIVRDLTQGSRTVLFSTHVMEHAERLCDRIILMTSGRVVFDGKTEDALARAPRRLTVGSDDDRLVELITPFAESVTPGEDCVMLDLKPRASSQAVLEKLVEARLRIARFEPRTPTLHEAFVAMVGADVLGDMAANVAEEAQRELSRDGVEEAR
jgi:ABC-2 type transport system ATP-binding protein